MNNLPHPHVFQVDVGNGNYIHVKVFEGLHKDEDLVLSGYQTDKTKDDEITYF